MKLVECVKDDWFFNALMRDAISKGAKVPKIGDRFVVKGSAFKIDEKVGYFLEEIDWSPYGIDVVWNIDKFIVIENEYIPNHFDTIHGIGECEIQRFSKEIKIDNDEETEEQEWTLRHEEEE